MVDGKGHCLGRTIRYSRCSSTSRRPGTKLRMMAEIAIPINVLNLFAAIIQENRITIDNEMSEHPPFTVYLAEESCWSNTGVKEISPSHLTCGQ